MRLRHTLLVMTAVVAMALAGAPARAQVAKPTAEDLELGKKVFFKRCVWCHGPKGDGEGAAFERAFPKPRNFNPGTFKIRTTDSGELPIDADLIRTVRKGLPGSLMPPWEHILSEKEIVAVVQFVKTKMVLDRKFDDPEETFKRIPGATDKDVIAPNPLNLSFPEKVAPSKDSIAKGAENFFRAGCFGCHGSQGRGEGNPSLKDEFPIPGFPEGAPIRAADLRQCWRFRGAAAGDNFGAVPEEIVREISTGLNGTPMPSSATELKTLPERWDVANFVIFLCGKTQSLDEMFEVAKDAPGKQATVEQTLTKATENPELQKQLGQGKFVTLKPEFAKSRMLAGRRPPLETIVTGTFIAGDLPTTVDDPRWKDVPTNHVRMGGQVSIEPRQFMPTVATLTVQAAYNDKNRMAFLLEWNDRDRSSVAKETEFIAGKADSPKQAVFLNPATNPKKVITNDAVEIQFPAKMHELSGTEKPFWINGDERRPVILWHWEADLAEAVKTREMLPVAAKKNWKMLAKLQQEPAVLEQIAKGELGDAVALYANGFKKNPFDPAKSVEEQSAEPTHRPRPADEQGIKSTDARHAGGQWRVVIHGPMAEQPKADKPSEGYTNVAAGLYMPIAFSVFDGSNGEQDTTRSISTWYAILPAPPLPKAIYYVPPIAAILIVGFELWLRRVSKRLVNGKGPPKP